MDLIKKINLDKIRNAAEDVINQAKPKTDVEARIYEALSHKNWGSSSTLQNEIARDTFDYDKYATITKIIWESLNNQRPAAWRVVFKALTLLEHLVKNGSERCVDDARNHSHVLRSLFNFNYYEGTTDRGIGVREKSKQLVELLGDDERVREERNKAKQLREKFGGNLGGVSSGGGGYSGGGGGGSGGSQYAGYGNDDYGGYSGGSSGYGDSGIGASSGFSGRYNDTNNETPTEDATPTFAAVPVEKKKKKSKKSKKKKEKAVVEEEVQPAPAAAPEIDLFDMDDPSPSNDSGFDAFQSAPAQSSNAADSFDAFGVSAPPEAPKSNSFDAFGDMNSAKEQNQQPQFDVFNSSAPVLGSAAQASSNNFDAFGVTNNNSGNNNTNNNMNDMFGNMSMNSTMSMNNNMNNMTMNNSMNNNINNMNMNSMNKSQSNIMGGGSRQKNNSADDDDFGDFADGNANTSKTQSSDPLSNLISLDSLTKNNTKKIDKTQQPIVFNQAAQNYVQNKDQISGTGQSQMSVNLAFSGVDGLNKMPSVTQANNGSRNNQGPVMNNNNNMMMNNNNMNMGMNNMSNNNNGMNMNMGMNNMSNGGNGNNMAMRSGNNMNAFGNNNGMSMNNMGMNSMMGGNNNVMNNGQQRNSMNQGGNMMMGGNMGGQQGNMGGQPGMMGGQPMGGGW